MPIGSGTSCTVWGESGASDGDDGSMSGWVVFCVGSRGYYKAVRYSPGIVGRGMKGWTSGVRMSLVSSVCVL